MTEVYLERERERDTSQVDDGRQLLLERVVSLAEELAHRPNLGLQAAPKREIERLAEMGLLMAPLPVSEGGWALGVEAGTQMLLLRIFAALGGADLALARIYEGHVNGLLLVQRYGTADQVARLAVDVRAGMLSGVWNTGRPEVLRLLLDGNEYKFEGVKTFATGAAFVKRPVVTAEIPGRGWQMTMPQMETLGTSIDRSFWHPLGMESSESFGVDFTGGKVLAEELIGSPGDFYQDPIFRGGAVRFAAAQAGAVMRLHALFAEWLTDSRRGEDPYQIARLGEVAISAQEAAMWVQKAAAVAEENFYTTDPAQREKMIECANMMRIAIERLATSVMRKVTMGVGAHGLLQPARFERIIRDLTMYLRQPAPDQTVAAVGRYALQKAHKRLEDSSGEFWSDSPTRASLLPGYFHRIYEKSHDPWSFETSEYERRKYAATLNALPATRYKSALEVGCSIGVLTGLLAERCDELLGLDVTERALEKARERCANLKHVRFACLRVPREMPEGEYDLIVISEVAYYWSRADLKMAADKLAQRSTVGGHLLLVHLTEWVPDYPLRGDDVHNYWLSRPEWRGIHEQRFERFRVDVLERVHD